MAIDFKRSIAVPLASDVGNRVTQGMVVSKTINLPLFTTNENAVWASRQQLLKESFPFALVDVVVNRSLFKLEVGDCFTYSYSKYGISNMVCRILRIEEEDLASERIIIHAMEDVFGVTSSITEYVDPTDHATGPPSYVLEPFVYQKVIEAPYVSSLSVIKVTPIACRVTDQDLGLNAYMSIDGGASYSLIGAAANIKPYGSLVGTYSETYTLDTDVGFTIDFVDDVELIETVTWSEVFSGMKNVAVLGDEIISFKSIEPISGTQYKLEGIVRARFGSKKVAHSEEESFFCFGFNTISMEHSEIISGVERKFKLVPYSIKYVGDISEAVPLDLTIEGQAKAPYFLVNFMANGGNYAARYSADIVLTWSPRYRGKGAGSGVPGVVIADSNCEGLFEIEVWVSEVKVRTTTEIDAVTWTYTEAMSISDNTTLPDIVTFKIVNYRVEGGVTHSSEQVTVVCKKS